MPTVTINNEVVEYKLKKLRIKDFSIRIKDGAFELIVPKRVKNDVIDKYLLDHQDWIGKRIHRQGTYILGGYIVYLGNVHMLETIVGNYPEPTLSLKDGEFTLVTNLENSFVLKRAIDEWLKGETKKIINEKIKLYKKILQVEPKEIYVEKLFYRWGSCSNYGNMKFNIRCAMLPDEIIDYVVVHELCHLIQLNHSKNFWKEVERVLPDYEMRQRWLNEEGAKFIDS